MYIFKQINGLEDLNEHDDNIVSEIVLSDYSWSSYSIKMQFQLKDKSWIIAEENYDLFTTSEFKLKHIVGDEIEELTFVATSDFVLRHLKQQLETHLKNFDDSECPANYDLCIEQYNEIIDLYRMVEANLPKRRTYKKGEENND